MSMPSRPAPPARVERRSTPTSVASLSPRPKPAERRRRWRPGFVLFLALLCGVSLAGAPYYLMPLGERVRSPMHPWFKPAGYIGQSAGLLALAIFLFLWLYPLRKKFRALAFTGTIAKWLNSHVLSALGLPLLVAIHAAWRFHGLIGLGFWSMMVVWFSGIVGRYLYVRIPRSRAGVELTIEEITGERQTLLAQIAAWSGLEPTVVEATLALKGSSAGRLGILGALRRMAADDWARRRAVRQLRRRWKATGRTRRKDDRVALKRMLRLARRQMALAQQVRLLDATHALFRYWHVLHRPVAVAALVAVLVHVAVVVSLGATWLW